jgi:hypothetical protein
MRPLKMTTRTPSMFIRPKRALVCHYPHYLLSACVVAFLLLSLASCKSAPQPPQTAAVPEDTRSNPDELTKSIPPDLFKELPIYPGATVEHVHKPKGAMREIAFSTPAQLNEVVEFFKEGLKKNDFHVTSSLIMPARKTWSCDFHNRGRPGSIMLFPSDSDKTRMTIDLIYELPAHIDESMMEPKEDFDVKGPGEIANQASNPNPNPSEKEKRN